MSIRIAAPHTRQNFHKRRVRRRPSDSAELNPIWRSDGSIDVGIPARERRGEVRRGERGEERKERRERRGEKGEER